MRSSHRPSALFTHARVLMAPWLPQCCTVSPIQAPPSPAHRHHILSLQLAQGWNLQSAYKTVCELPWLGMLQLSCLDHAEQLCNSLSQQRHITQSDGAESVWARDYRPRFVRATLTQDDTHRARSR